MSQKAYKFRFYPQPDLVILLAKTFGCTRFIYNKVLAYSEQYYLSKFIDGNHKNIDPLNINPNYKSLSNNDRINYVTTLKNLTKINQKKKSTAGTAANACRGNVRPKSSKLNLTKKIEASSNETRIPLL